MLCNEEIVQQVWEKGIAVDNNDAQYWRQDECGAWISRSNYGHQQSPFGWEINYILPQTVKGGQDLQNLRPVQWKNNIYKKDGNMVCVLKAVKTKNQDIL
jgi:hypothetical protein